jgi:hypothetical protein
MERHRDNEQLLLSSQLCEQKYRTECSAIPSRTPRGPTPGYDGPPEPLRGLRCVGSVAIPRPLTRPWYGAAEWRLLAEMPHRRYCTASDASERAVAAAPPDC